MTLNNSEQLSITFMWIIRWSEILLTILLLEGWNLSYICDTFIKELKLSWFITATETWQQLSCQLTPKVMLMYWINFDKWAKLYKLCQSTWKCSPTPVQKIILITWCCLDLRNYKAVNTTHCDYRQCSNKAVEVKKKSHSIWYWTVKSRDYIIKNYVL